MASDSLLVQLEETTQGLWFQQHKLACQVPPGETITEVLHMDTSSEDQVGVGWDHMQELSMYVTLISDLSELGNSGGPVFNLLPGVLAWKN